MTITELWKPIPFTKNIYSASNLGRIRRNYYFKGKRAKDGIIKPRLFDGYLRVNLSIEGKHTTKTVHFLVANAFLGDIPSYLNINHKNGNKQDNSIDNLEYITITENNRHAFNIGLIPTKDRHYSVKSKREHFHHLSKLTKQDILNIRHLASKGVSQRQLAKEYQVNKNAISQIIHRKSWKNI